MKSGYEEIKQGSQLEINVRKKAPILTLHGVMVYEHQTMGDESYLIVADKNGLYHSCHYELSDVLNDYR